MSGYVMWAVLGSLIGLVAIFLVVTTILDRKKRKKIKDLQKQNQAEIDEAKFEILYFVSEVMKSNSKLMKNFVPSVGKIKMSDIRTKGKDAIKKIMDSKEYKLIEDEADVKELIGTIEILKATNSNIWDKSPQAIWVNEEIKKLENSTLTQEYKDIVTETLKEIY